MIKVTCQTCVVLPMGLCAFGGSKITAVDGAMLVSAGLGAVVLGATLGGIGGARLGKTLARQARKASAQVSARRIDSALLPADYQHIS